jgi:membrane protein
MVIKGFRVWPLLRGTVREIGADRIPTLAASAAYNFFFSLFPLLLFLSPMLAVIGDRDETMGWLMAQLTSTLTPTQAEAMRPLLQRIVFAENAPSLMSIGLLLAAWSGSNIFGTLMEALNTAYDVKESRPWVRQQIIRLGVFVVGVVVIVLATTIFLQGEAIATRVGTALHLAPAAIWTWKVLQYPIASLGLVTLAFITFYFLPNARQRRGQVLLAAVVTTALWIAATLLFRVYVNYFPPNDAYGLIGAVIVLLTWMYYTMFVLLCGGELASEIHHGTGAVDPERGAVYLERLVT